MPWIRISSSTFTDQTKLKHVTSHPRLTSGSHHRETNSCSLGIHAIMHTMHILSALEAFFACNDALYKLTFTFTGGRPR